MRYRRVRQSVKYFFAVFALVALLSPTLDAEAYAPGSPNGTYVQTIESAGSDGLALVRLTIEPGVSLRTHEHPSEAIFSVESGVLETTLRRGEGTVSWAPSGTGDAVEQVIEVGETVVLEAGDSISLSADAAKTLINDGDEELRLVATMMVDGEDQVFTFDLKPRSVNPHLQ